MPDVTHSNKHLPGFSPTRTTINMPDMSHTSTPSSISHDLVGELKRLICVLLSGWRLIAVSVVVCLTLAALYLARAPRVYRATARVLVIQQGGRPLNVGHVDPGQLVERTDDLISTHAAVISSPLVVGQAIESVGLESLPSIAKEESPLEAAVERLMVRRPDRTAKILQIQYQAGSREEATRMVEAITASYGKFLADTYQKSSGEVITLITKARDDLSKEIAELELKYLEFRQNHSVLSTDETGRSFVARRLDQWDRAANEALVKAIRLKAQLELGRKMSSEGAGLRAIAHAMGQVGDESASLVGYAAGETRASSSGYIGQLEQAREELAERYGPQYSKVQEIQEQITRIQQRTRLSRGHLDKAETGDLLGAVEVSLRSINAMRDELKTRFDQDREQARKVETDLLAEANLRGNLERHRSLFNTVVEQLKQAQFVSDYSSVSSQTIEPANALRSPVSPRATLTLALALIAGGMMGLGAAVVADRLDSRIRSVEELRQITGLCVLGQIPRVSEEQVASLGELGLATHTMPGSFMAEGYRAVRTNLDFLRRGARVQVIMVASPHSGDGKSVSASNLAISLAQAGRKVLLVDGDIRKPSQHRIHNISRDRGLAQILVGTLPIHRVTQHSPVDNLDLIASGPEVPNPAELLTSPRFAEFVEEARQSYDVVIIDSSPILAVTDPMIIAAAVDGVMLVVRASALRHHEAMTTLELLRASGVTVFGLLLNGDDLAQRGYGYGYGYGSQESTLTTERGATPSTVPLGEVAGVRPSPSANGRTAPTDFTGDNRDI